MKPQPEAMMAATFQDHWHSSGRELEPAINLQVDPRNQETRIRAALGLDRGALPHVSGLWLDRYYHHLAQQLSFPFTAQYAGDLKPLGQPPLLVTVVSLLHPSQTSDCDQVGLACQATDGHTEVILPLVDLEVIEDSVNAQQIEDYWYWFWNWRFDPRI